MRTSCRTTANALGDPSCQAQREGADAQNVDGRHHQANHQCRDLQPCRAVQWRYQGEADVGVEPQPPLHDGGIDRPCWPPHEAQKDQRQCARQQCTDYRDHDAAHGQGTGFQASQLAHQKGRHEQVVRQALRLGPETVLDKFALAADEAYGEQPQHGNESVNQQGEGHSGAFLPSVLRSLSGWWSIRAGIPLHHGHCVTVKWTWRDSPAMGWLAVMSGGGGQPGREIAMTCP